MTDLEKFQKVNSCETSAALTEAVESLCDELGMIQGRTRQFNGIKMAEMVDLVVNHDALPNLLTREFGIRQQALYLKAYR